MRFNCLHVRPHRFLDAAGYAVSTYAFSGPFLDPEAIHAGTLVIDQVAGWVFAGLR
jgi:hypothetical protein